jgi:hypothetical protein
MSLSLDELHHAVLKSSIIVLCLTSFVQSFQEFYLSNVSLLFIAAVIEDISNNCTLVHLLDQVRKKELFQQKNFLFFIFLRFKMYSFFPTIFPTRRTVVNIAPYFKLSFNLKNLNMKLLHAHSSTII